VDGSGVSNPFMVLGAGGASFGFSPNPDLCQAITDSAGVAGAHPGCGATSAYGDGGSNVFGGAGAAGLIIVTEYRS
jgi:hypothetical protein